MPHRRADNHRDSEYETTNIITSDPFSDSELETRLQHNIKHRKSTQKRSRKSKGKKRQETTVTNVSSSEEEEDVVEVIQLAKKSKKHSRSSSQAQGYSKEDTEHFKSELKKVQLALDKVKTENKQLKLQIAEPKYKAAGPSKSKKTSNSDDEEIDCKDRVGLLARKFGVMNEMFIEPHHFMVENPDVDPYGQNRYLSPQSRVLGLVSELFREIPEDLHDAMINDSRFRDDFVTKLNSSRRQIVLRLRNTSAPSIFSTNKVNYEPNTDRSKIKEFVKAVYRDPMTQKFSKFAPILFPGGIVDMNKLFKCQHLALMLRSILFGPGSLANRRPQGPKTVGVLWGVDYVTPGAIALVSVLAIFLHSNDSTLAQIGAKSKIPYQDLFDKYKAILVVNMKNKDPVTEELFAYYNDIVFGWKADKKDMPVGSEEDYGDSDSSGIEGAIRRVQNVQIDEPVEATATTNVTNVSARVVVEENRPQPVPATVEVPALHDAVVEPVDNLPEPQPQVVRRSARRRY